MSTVVTVSWISIIITPRVRYLPFQSLPGTSFPNQWSYSLIRTACLNGTSDKLKAVPSTSTEGKMCWLITLAVWVCVVDKNVIGGLPHSPASSDLLIIPCALLMSSIVTNGQFHPTSCALE